MFTWTSGTSVFAFYGPSGQQTSELACRVERLGYGALWIPEGAGRDPFAHAGYLLSQTERLVVASGIANVFMREPGTSIRAARTLCELFDDRFILGLGVSGKLPMKYEDSDGRSPSALCGITL